MEFLKIIDSIEFLMGLQIGFGLCSLMLLYSMHEVVKARQDLFRIYQHLNGFTPEKTN